MNRKFFAALVLCQIGTLSSTTHADVSTSYTQIARPGPLEVEYYATVPDSSHLLHHVVYLAKASMPKELAPDTAAHMYEFEGAGRVDTSFILDPVTHLEFAVITFTPTLGQPTTLKLDIRPFVYQACTEASDGKAAMRGTV